MVPVKLEGDPDILCHPLLVQTQDRIEKETGRTLENAVNCAPQSGVAKAVVCNRSSVIQFVPMGACLGEAEAAQVLYVPEPGESDLDTAQYVAVTQITLEPQLVKVRNFSGP